jgi:hypothetical protein
MIPRLRLTGKAVGHELKAELVMPDGSLVELAPYRISIEAKPDKLIYATLTMEIESMNVEEWPDVKNSMRGEGKTVDGQ